MSTSEREAEEAAGRMIGQGPGVFPAPWTRQPPTWGAELAEALACAQQAAQAVEKNAENSFHRYKYASAESLIAEARDALSANGLSVMPVSIDCDETQRDHRWESGQDDKGNPTSWIVTPRRIRVRYRLLHRSGQWMDFESTAPVIPEKGRPEDKAEFGSRTENLGYALRDLLLIPREAADGATNPSARDDRNSEPRGPKGQQARGSNSSPPSQPASNQTSGSVSGSGASSEKPSGQLDAALRITNLMQNKAPDGLGWPKPRAADWLKARFGRAAASALTAEQQKDAIILLLARMQSEEDYDVKVAAFAADGRCSPRKDAAA